MAYHIQSLASYDCIHELHCHEYFDTELFNGLEICRS